MRFNSEKWNADCKKAKRLGLIFGIAALLNTLDMYHPDLTPRAIALRLMRLVNIAVGDSLTRPRVSRQMDKPQKLTRFRGFES